MTVLFGIAAAVGGPAHAQNATWNGPGTDWDTGANWNPQAVPTDTATFTNDGAPTSVTFSASTTNISTIQYTAGAPNFTYTIAGSQLNVEGIGIVNNAAGAPTFVLANPTPIGNGFQVLSGFMEFDNQSTAGNSIIIVGANVPNATGPNISNSLGLSPATLTFNNSSTAGTAAITNEGGVINFNNTSTAGNSTIVLSATNLGGPAVASLFFSDSSMAGNATITVDNNNIAFFQDNSSGGQARFIINSGGAVDLESLPAHTQFTAGSIEGAGNFFLGDKTLVVGSNNLSTTFGGTITEGVGPFQQNGAQTGGSLIKVGSGTLTLAGINDYTGPTTVNAGTLEVDGSIATSSLTAVNSGATLTGIGAVGPTQIQSGGVFAPGASNTPTTSMTVTGNLVFASGAIYQIFLNPTGTTFSTVSGSATLAGTVDANFAPGNYISKQYTILTASGGVSGTFSSLLNVNLPAGATDMLVYDANHAYLDITLGTGSPTYGALNVNQNNVANTLVNYFNDTGGIPAQFFSLGQNALTQIDGELATDAERGAFLLTDQFLEVMLDPFVDGRSGAGWPFGSATANSFAPDQQASLPPDIALAYASVLRAQPATFDQRWTEWAAGFGGSNTSTGNAAIGSTTVIASDYGYAAGMDYHFNPHTVAGFALAGGGTNWTLTQGLGTGRSNDVQAGAYGVTRSGPFYLAGAVAFANHWMSTNRTALNDQLTASFTAQSFGVRAEGGYRYMAPVGTVPIGITPYAAMQAQTFHAPSYSETDLTGGGFGLSYNALNSTDTRGELGVRFDDATMVGTMPLTLRARLAWAHDWVRNPAISAAFETLPGTSFTVNGAPIPPNSALASIGAVVHFNAAWSIAAKFDGQFAQGSETFAGTGTLRYIW